MHISSILQSAVTAHQAGDLDSAGQMYAQVLQSAPDSADAWHLSGVLALQLGRVQQAIDQIELALQLQPSLHDAWTNLAAAQLAAGNAEAAEQSCRECLQHVPTSPRAWMLLANAMREQQRPLDALSVYQQAYELAPDDAIICCNYGSCLLVCGQLERARELSTRALELAPSLQEARVNLGSTLRRLHDLPRAESVLRDAIGAAPDHVEALINLANVLREKLALEEAAELVATALRQAPNNPKAWNLQGLILQAQASQTGDGSVAGLQSLQRAAELDPAKFVSPLLYAISLAHELSPDGGSPERSWKSCFQEHCRWADALPTPTAPLQPRVVRDPHRPLRIGMLSGDFRNHAVSRFLLSWLPELDPTQFLLYLYSEADLHDEVTMQYQELSHRWLDTCGMSDAELAHRIRDEQVDILIDLAGHTARSRLSVMNWRPAPIQMTFLGYPNTTGLQSVDYYVTDAQRDPPGSEEFYREQLLRLDGPAICFAAPLGAPEVSPAPVERNGHLTFGSLHRLGKLNRSVAQVWANLVRQVKDAKLLIVRDTLRSPEQQDRVMRLLTHEGIPAESIELRSSWRDSYFEHYADIDLLLPVFPWGGGTTTYEAMWMGALPLVSQWGRPSSKAAVAALRAVGLADWLATDEDDLSRVALRLATDGVASSLRTDLRRRMQESVCDGKQYAERLSRTLRIVWQRWLDRTNSASGADHEAR